MQAYTDFAAVYDRFMEVPYDQWKSYLLKELQKEQIEAGLILELGCGTGQMTERLFRAGYDMIGIDNSEEMLSVARERQMEEREAEEAGAGDILYLEQDMREFELYGTVRAVISVADTMNYLTEKEDFVETLQLVNNYLDPEGIFIFDLKTEHAFRDCMGDQVFAFQDEDASLIWENAYYEEDKINEYQLTVFLLQEDNLYSRNQEYHYQRAYDLQEIREMAEASGMKLEKICDADTGKEWTEKTERVFVTLREQGKKEKVEK